LWSLWKIVDCFPVVAWPSVWNKLCSQMEITCISVAQYLHGLHSNIMNTVNVQMTEHTHLHLNSFMHLLGVAFN
jgi:hypothetical protein